MKKEEVYIKFSIVTVVRSLMQSVEGASSQETGNSECCLSGFFPKLKVTPSFRNAPIIILPKRNFCEHSAGINTLNPIHHLRKMVHTQFPMEAV